MDLENQASEMNPAATPQSEPKPEWRRPVLSRIGVAETLFGSGSFTDGESGSAES